MEGEDWAGGGGGGCCKRIRWKAIGEKLVGKTLKASLLLAIGYFSSQGLYFLFQVWLKYRGMHELLGEFVVLVGVFSFSFQFSEFGNYSYLLRPKISGTKDEHAFVTSRAIVGLVLASIFSYASARSLQVRFLDPYFWIAPFVAFGMAISPNYINEKKLNYTSIVGLQFYVWVTLIGSLLLIAFYTVDPGTLALLWIILFSTILIILWKATNGRPKFVRTSFENIKQFTYIVFGGLASQLWGRTAVIYIMGVVGASWIGSYSIIRSIQGMIILILWFSIRPKMVAFFVSEGQLDRKNIKRLIKIVYPVLMLSIALMFIPLIIYVSSTIVSDKISYKINKYYEFFYLFLSTPSLLGISIASQISQHVNTGNRQAIIDGVSLAGNILAFFVTSNMLNNKDPIFPFIIGDSTQFIIFVFLLSYTFLANNKLIENNK